MEMAWNFILAQVYEPCHGACPGNKKHKTVCTLACLTPLLYAIHGNNSHYASILSNILKMPKNVNKCVR